MHVFKYFNFQSFFLFFSSLFSKVLHFDIKLHVIDVSIHVFMCWRCKRESSENKKKSYLLVNHIPVVKIVIFYVNKFHFMRRVSLMYFFTLHLVRKNRSSVEIFFNQEKFLVF